jgi:hypothetical protein
MARHLRVEYPGGFDHFTARDTDQQTIVHAATDRTDLLDAARAEDFAGSVGAGPRQAMTPPVLRI